MFYFYVLFSLKDKKPYWGYTSNLKLRLCQHQAGLNRSTSYRRPLKLVYYEAYLSKQDAQNREHQIKKRGKAYTGIKRRIERSMKLCS